MDQPVLVREQVDGGEKLLARLRERGFDTVAAFWAKTAEDTRWYLYLVTPAVDQKGLLDTYGEIGDALRELNGAWSHPFERIDSLSVKVLSPSSPTATTVLDFQAQYQQIVGPWFYAPSIEGVSPDGPAYVYPSPAPQPAGS
jgi:hypothetical protein